MNDPCQKSLHSVEINFYLLKEKLQCYIVYIWQSPAFFRKGGGGGVIERDGAGRLVDPIKTIVPMNKDYLDLQSNFS